MSAAAQPAHVLSAAQIAHLAHDSLEGAPPADPLILLVQEDEDGVSFLAPPYGPESFLERLVGLDVSTGIGAIAIASTGRIWALDGAALTGSGEPVDVLVGFALLRNGSSATYVTGPDGPVLLDEQGVGRVPDLCHLALGLPTPPPEVGTDIYLTRKWLHALLGEATAKPGALTWEQAAALHPVGAAGLDTGADPLQLAGMTRMFAIVIPWSVLRRRFVAEEVDDPPAPLPSSPFAAWLDDGTFSRWMLDPLPSPDEAYLLLEELVPPDVLAEIWTTVEITEELAQQDDLDDLWDDEVWDDDDEDEPRLDGWVNPCP
jgi:hypothetical protein